MKIGGNIISYVSFVDWKQQQQWILIIYAGFLFSTWDNKQASAISAPVSIFVEILQHPYSSITVTAHKGFLALQRKEGSKQTVAGLSTWEWLLSDDGEQEGADLSFLPFGSSSGCNAYWMGWCGGKEGNKIRQCAFFTFSLSLAHLFFINPTTVTEVYITAEGFFSITVYLGDFI